MSRATVDDGRAQPNASGLQEVAGAVYRVRFTSDIQRCDGGEPLSRLLAPFELFEHVGVHVPKTY